ncbi:MAG: hypothetical protein V4723_21565 [Pseudomonadota bacterium]
MNSRIASEERIHFRDRLLQVLRQANVPVRASTVAHEFNLRADGATVTTHAVRKCLVGDSIPTHERLVILGNWLGVHASWLLYGDAENSHFALNVPPSSLTSQELMLVRDFNSLDSGGQHILREILNVLMTSMNGATKSGNGRDR